MIKKLPENLGFIMELLYYANVSLQKRQPSQAKDFINVAMQHLTDVIEQQEFAADCRRRFENRPIAANMLTFSYKKNI